MGKPYATELEKLRATFAWASKVEIGELVRAAAKSAAHPLVAVGSGGSLSAAHHVSALHQEYTGLLSKAVTPLELVRSSLHLGGHAAVFLSAGGTNVDIVGSFRNAIEREPRRCTALCFRRGSALSQLAARFPFVDLVEMAPPTRKDGFLSTNSLLAFAVLLERAYALAFGKGDVVPREFDELLPSQQVRDSCRPLWTRDTVLVLHGSSVHFAAVDLESKFSEAALGHAQVADFRNFAHGRHNWLARRGDTTGVFAMFSDADQELADATLRLLPRSVPVARIHLPTSGAPARIAALLAVLHLVGDAGVINEIDPGRPRVPPFGRKIYHLQAFSKAAAPNRNLDAISIARKVQVDVHAMNGPALEPWRRAQHDFIAALDDATYGAVLFDYDGTLCDSRDRFNGLRVEIASALKHLLKGRLLVGVATGRGKSVREALRKVLPAKAWSSVLVGYYNCTDIAWLTDDARPDASSNPVGPLGEIAKVLATHPAVAAFATTEIRPKQISLQPASAAASQAVWRTALDLVQARDDLKIVRSSHSVDILTSGASKTALLKALRERVAPKAVLVIGDMGRWPGNDHDILAGPHSLSVDEVSSATDSCWNLAPAGHRGVQATLHYLDAIIARGGAFRLDVRKLGRKERR